MDSFPQCGGVFQYNQAILQALIALPQEQFKIFALYSHREWEAQLEKNHVPSLYIRNSIFSKLLNTALDRLRFPTVMWRRISMHLFSIPRVMIKQHCDLWIFPSQDDWGYNANVNSLIAIHDLMHRYERRFPEVSSRWEYGKRERRYRKICKWAKGILVDSQKGQDHVTESYGLDRMRIYILPYIVPHYILSPGCSKAFDAKYPLPVKYIFYPAQFWQHKNHRNLLQAMVNLRDQLPDLHFVFVGSEKNSLAHIRRIITEFNLQSRVTIFEYIPDSDMAEFYRRARAMVMPTFFGPTNIPPLEAMATGCPLAVSNIYAIPEQVGNAAILFSPDSIDDIANALYKLWTNDRLCTELASRGKNRIKELSQHGFNDRFLDILRDVLNELTLRVGCS